jgi:hypothetical protein
VPTYGFTISEHDQHKPWLVVGTEHRTVDLEPSINFFAWAAERWPPDRFSVRLDPDLGGWPPLP